MVDDMDDARRLEVKRASVKRQLKVFFTFTQNCQIDHLPEMQERYERIGEVWKSFQDLQLELEWHYVETKNDEAFKSHIGNGESYEKRYYEAVALARAKIEEGKRLIPKEEPRTFGRTNNVLKIKLPSLVIQPFSDNYEQWLSFKDSFTKAVHDQEDLPNVQKFQLLKGLLLGDASKLISALEATDANYDIAWELLENRYSNTRMITHTHMKSLFELTPISKPNRDNLRQMVDDIRMHTRSLKALKQPVDQWNTILIYLITSKLDNSSKEVWEKELTDENDDNPTLEKLLKFLEKRCLILELIDKCKIKTEQASSFQPNKKEKKVSLPVMSKRDNPVQGESSAQREIGCQYCKGGHAIYKCETFFQLANQERFNEVKKRGLCLNCLRPGHLRRDCKASSCRRCNAHHNTLLHTEFSETSQQSKPSGSGPPPSKTAQPPAEQQVVGHCAPQRSRVVLSTAEVLVTDSEGREQRCCALLDAGSQSNIITEDLARRLKVKQNRVDFPISGVNQATVRVDKSARITIKSTTSRFIDELECIILPAITDHLPQVSLDLKKLCIPKVIELADPNFNETKPIDMLLGAGVFWKIICPGENVTTKGQPTFQNTSLGWIVGGEFNAQTDKSTHRVCGLVTNCQLQNQLENFWRVEELNIPESGRVDEDYCQTHFKDTYTRLDDGRFQVRLPQIPNVVLGDSFSEAFKRLRGLERRFDKNPDWREEYVDFLREYEEAQHMSLVQESNDDTSSHYYLLHLAIVKESSLTTRIRVVFDASSKTTLGTSLNDKLLPGPNLQNELFNILLRFRCHEYVLTADVKQMFRQISVHSEDRDLQRILWRNEKDQPVRIYPLNTVTYGTSCAPFLALRCLKQLACDAKDTFPKAAELIDQDFYMDDLLTGASSKSEAISLQQQISDILAAGKFQLRKWRSNEPEVLGALATEPNEELLILDRDSEKTLGLLWNSKKDSVQYRVNVSEVSKISKRQMLSSIAKIYDPIGLIGPVLITAKIFIQQLWQCNIGWDEDLPASLESKWRTYFQTLSTVSELEIQRNVNPGNGTREILLHGFCDASEKAYGACLYVQSINKNGEKATHLLCSKSKVVRSGEEGFEITETHLWSDSTIALCWIATPPSNLKTFVSNRVVEIQEKSSGAQWHYVPSKENPADHVSRGVAADIILTLENWWYGPQWLTEPTEWPRQILEKIDEIPERRKTAVTLVATNIETDLRRRYSSFGKFQRIVAYCFRFLDLLKGQRITGALSVEELGRARLQILRWTQAECFPLEMAQLDSGKTVHRKSPLLMLKPFKCQDGLIRVGGRLENADVSSEQRHPVILPAKHHITQVILRDKHIEMHHCGPQQLLHAVRENYWPLSGMREVRKVTRSCVPCFKYRPKVPDLVMGNLPSSRVNVSTRPFETTGCDYAGPFQVRERRRRGRLQFKGYAVVFVCFTTKAIHLELASDLTTEAFLAALRRFSARRGCCSTMYSDNGTNFVGAANELKEIHQFLTTNENTIKSTLAAKGIT